MKAIIRTKFLLTAEQESHIFETFRTSAFAQFDQGRHCSSFSQVHVYIT